MLDRLRDRGRSASTCSSCVICSSTPPSRTARRGLAAGEDERHAGLDRAVEANAHQVHVHRVPADRVALLSLRTAGVGGEPSTATSSTGASVHAWRSTRASTAKLTGSSLPP